MRKTGTILALIATILVLSAAITVGRCIEHLADWGAYLTGVGILL